MPLSHLSTARQLKHDHHHLEALHLEVMKQNDTGVIICAFHAEPDYSSGVTVRCYPNCSSAITIATANPSMQFMHEL